MLFRINKNVNYDVLKNKLDKIILDKKMPQVFLTDFDSECHNSFNFSVNPEVSINGTRFRSFVKKIIRKFTRFIVYDIVNQQNVINNKLIEKNSVLENVVTTQKHEIELLKKEIKELKK